MIEFNIVTPPITQYEEFAALVLDSYIFGDEDDYLKDYVKDLYTGKLSLNKVCNILNDSLLWKRACNSREIQLRSMYVENIELSEEEEEINKDISDELNNLELLRNHLISKYNFDI